MYSQNNEEKVILSYFEGSNSGRFLDIGAADGVALSNTRALREKGWSGVLVEPNPHSFVGLMANYPEDDCSLVNVAVAPEGGLQKFHLTPDMVSTMDENHRKLWGKTVSFREAFVNILSVAELLKAFPGPYDFINIDVEGMNYEILVQLPLASLQCQLLCIEFGSQYEFITAMLEGKGWKRIHENAENYIYQRP